jgi:hypothetical protein
MSTIPITNQETPTAPVMRMEQETPMPSIAYRPHTPQQQSAWLFLLDYAITHKSCRLWIAPLTRWLEGEVG